MTEHEYDVVVDYRDRGGHLAFLCANNFYWRVDRQPSHLLRVEKWRRLRRPEAGLIGVQYIGNDEGEARGPWIVRATRHTGWLFAGTGRTTGSSFSNGGIEIDGVAPNSPRGTVVVAEIPDLLGHGLSGQMSYYETPVGARVFAAGAFSLAGSVFQPPVSRLLANVWRRLATTEHLRRPSVHGAHASVSAGGYGWPVKPFFAQHPVRGYFGDPRIGRTRTGAVSHRFHFGIDVACPNGEPVYATISGTVELESFRPEVVSVRADDRRTELEYWHVSPAVRNGQRVVAYRTVVGHVVAPWAHVHLAELQDGDYVNPLRAGALRPYHDTTSPTIRALLVARAGVAAPADAPTGTFTLVVEATDTTPIPVPPPWHAKPVTPALVRWRFVRRGEPTPAWNTVVDVRRGIPDDDRYWGVYDAQTRQNHASTIGRYGFVLARGLDPAQIERDARIEVEAGDTRGNRARAWFDVSAARLSPTVRLPPTRMAP